MRKIFYIAFFILISVSCNAKSSPSTEENSEEDIKRVEFLQLKAKADSALLYCKEKKMSTDYCILIDFSKHSGKNRMFVWNFKTDTIHDSSLCCHGAGLGSSPTKPIFSNEVGSNCSSLGKYKVGGRYPSSWGTKFGYKLHGLEKTNNNAYSRYVTMHSHSPVPPYEIYPRHLPMGYSFGCTIPSDKFLLRLDTLIKQQKKPLLLWVYI